MPKVTIPARFTECEVYRGFVIAIYNQRYAGFGIVADTRNCDTRAEVRDHIDAMYEKGLIH